MNKKLFLRVVIIQLISLVFVLLPTSGKAQVSSTIIGNGLIAFASEQDGDMEIYTMNADGSDIVQLTHNDGEDTDPNWSPDGSQIAYISDTGPLVRHLQIMNADGTNQSVLSSSIIAAFNPEWSPDGTRIAFISFQSDAFNIFTVHPDGSNLTQLTFGHDGMDGGSFYQPAWSPDGQYLAYLIGEVGGSARFSQDTFSLYTIDLSTLISAHLPADPAFNNLDWSPDGQTIIFEGSSLGAEIQAINPDGTNYRAISDIYESHNNPAWSPDGQQIVFEVSGTDIGIMDANGENIVNVTNTPDVWEIDPHWQPSGMS